MILHVLGAGTPIPTPDRYGTSFVLQLERDFLMFDCGPAATHKLVKAGLHPTQIDHLFFTHHHYDHDVDFPCFLLCRWDQAGGKAGLLKVWGPPPTAWFIERLIGPEGAFSFDWKARVGHPGSQMVHVERGGSLPRPPPSCDVHEIGPGKVVETDRWTVTAAPARHAEPWLESLAFRVDTDEGSIVIASDTGPCDTVTELTRGADILVISCWDHQEAMDRHWEQVNTKHARTMMGTENAAALAKECSVKKLVITHAIPNLAAPGSRERGIEDMARIYHGEIIFPDELTAIELN